MGKYILAIDQGTTGSRAFVFDNRGRVVSKSYQEFRQYYPKPGWVEHDAEEIWESCLKVVSSAIRLAKINSQDIRAIGITNQRETTVVWDRKTSRPMHRAIVWQCRRTSEMCRLPKFQKARSVIQKKTGLLLDPYFSGTKMRWFLEHVPGLKAKANASQAAFGTIDSWLIWKLTGGQSHVTDMTNASRTMLFNIHTKEWDTELLQLFGVPPSALAKVLNSGSVFGLTAKTAGLSSRIPIHGVRGDQQAALYGQGCFDPGSIKNTYGTGCFMVLNTGHKSVLSKNGLLTTLACDVNGQPVYALEGAVFIAGAAMQWLRDELGCLKTSSDSERMIRGLKNTNGVYFVPAFTGLGAPYWDDQARGIICGLTRGANVRHIIRAALESIAYQTKDVFEIMIKECGLKIKAISVDGGACQNDFLMQFQSDVLGVKIHRPQNVDSTVLGAAYLAGVSAQLYEPRKLSQFLKKDAVFSPKMPVSEVSSKYEGWRQAVNRARFK
ncbi:MAG: glycerol kinase GlpK [Candidatus Omnitrophica bacterium]|nr:glycerol kinase GlpK [Candidatus Omnitrophota bacterium]